MNRLPETPCPTSPEPFGAFAGCFLGLPHPHCRSSFKMRCPNLKQHRRSACAETSLRAEMKRVSRMTIEERVKAALSMGERFSRVKDIATKQH